MRTCEIDGCEREHAARGWCLMHYMRWRKHGDPLKIVKQRSATGICSFPGCERPHDSRGYCTTHGMRLRKHGDAGIVKKGGVARRQGHATAIGPGYRYIYLPEHPLSGKSGQVLEHRAVLFDKIGVGPHTCHHCERHIGWRQRLPHRLEVDHLDFDVQNNDPANLVQSCIYCNSKRHQG